jgi:putative ABC transport system permease protein
MNITQAIVEALESLNANKMRSGLTILGIVIGVGAVIAMLSIGQGAQTTITGSISDIGTNLLFVISGGNEDIRNPRPLTLGDAAAMADPFAAPSVAAVAPAIQGSAQVAANGQEMQTSVTGTTPAYLAMRDLKLIEGDYFTPDQELGRASVALIGTDIADNLFGHRDGLVGETIRVNGQPFRVIGVLAARGGGFGGSQDNEIIMPLESAQVRVLQRTNRDRVGMILVQVTDSQSIPQATDEITQILRQRHRTPIGADDFTIFSQQDFINVAQTVTGVLTIFLGGIAAISLLVGGIGIMNIMLVSVTERTREIGVRMAVGARRGDILLQFLVEALVISLLGGGMGLLLGAMFADVMENALRQLNFKTEINATVIIWSLATATVVGVFSGIYPAFKASRLDPVDALRHE